MDVVGIVADANEARAALAAKWAAVQNRIRHAHRQRAGLSDDGSLSVREAIERQISEAEDELAAIARDRVALRQDVHNAGAWLADALVALTERSHDEQRCWLFPPSSNAMELAEHVATQARRLVREQGTESVLLHVVSKVIAQLEEPAQAERAHELNRRLAARRIFKVEVPSRPDVLRRIIEYAGELQKLFEARERSLDEHSIEELSMTPAWLIINGRILCSAFDELFFHFARTSKGRVSKSSRGRMTRNESPAHSVKMVARAIKKLPRELVDLLTDQKSAAEPGASELDHQVAIARAMLKAFGAASPKIDEAFRFLD